MSERKIHPDVFVEVECDDTDSGRQTLLREINSLQRRECAFARIQQNARALRSASKNDVNRTVVVEVGSNCSAVCSVKPERGFFRDVSEGAVAVVAPKGITRRSAGLRGDVEIEIAVVIVIDKRQRGATGVGSDANRFGFVGEFAATVVVKQMHAVIHADSEIGLAIVVVVSGGTADPDTPNLDS